MILNNVRSFLKRFEQAKAEKSAREIATSIQTIQPNEDEIIDELTDIFQKKYLDNVDMNFAVMSASCDDDLSFKAWQTCEYFSCFTQSLSLSLFISLFLSYYYLYYTSP